MFRAHKSYFKDEMLTLMFHVHLLRQVYLIIKSLITAIINFNYIFVAKHEANISVKL